MPEAKLGVNRIPSDYTLNFDLSAYKALDSFALLADQKYNLGDKNDWFGCFRGGLGGLYARVLGVKIHYHKIHAWELDVKPPQVIEYNLSSIFFNMDSAIECMVFALNALGYIADSNLFIDIADEKKLKMISPYNIVGSPPKYSAGLIPGYVKYFSSLKEYWSDNRNLIFKISEQHDVSKHRSVIFSGGTLRNDPPPDFFERLGIAGDKFKNSLFSPMAEIILTYQPKTPWRQRKPHDYKDIDKLEDIAERFCTFINTCGLKALEDARNTIKLQHYDFIR